MNPRLSLVAACFLLSHSASGAQETADFKPMYAKHASLAERTISPDGKVSVSLRPLPPEPDTEFPKMVEVNVAGKKLTAKIFFGLNAEVLWSPDSKAFAVSGSGEGANGLYWVDVFVLKPDRLAVVPLTRVIQRAFGHPVKCGWPEDPNVVAVTWIEPSVKILVAAEIIHHSNCDSFGTFKAYEVDVTTGTITRTLNQLEAKRLYGKDLGEELSSAPDNCIRDPKSCYVGANHPASAHQ